jgi:Flp pilus assembly protein TadD
MSIGKVGSTGALQPTSSPTRSAWIISPAADLVFLIATPLLIVPVTLFVVRQHFTIEQISLVVVAFASIGHQLPGFLRAYGDAALFARYRWRMLLGPPIALAAAWLVAQTQLHGLVLLLLLWSTWHVLMQTYGMLRIYDLKRGWATQRRARIDFWACMALFAWGFVSSEPRLFMVAETAWRIGLPMLTAQGAEILRWFVAGGAVVMLACYVLSLTWDYRVGQLVWIKPLLLLSTGWLYWLCGTSAIPVLLGIAMFEVFHAIQYDALVWAYDRKLGTKLGQRMGPLRRFFERRGSFVIIYMAAIAAFGALRFLPGVIVEPQTQTLLLAAITASTLMHFYFDGFIWKVSANQRQQLATSVTQRSMWEIPHALKCAGLMLIVGGLLLLESRASPQPADEANWLANAASWAPNLADVQLRLCRAQVARGEIAEAIETARRVTALQPDSADAHADLGVILLRAHQYPEAVTELSEATRLDPARWQNQFDLGLVQTQLANWDEAEKAFATADRIQPQNTQIQREWADLELARGDAAAAAERLQKLIAARSLHAEKSAGSGRAAVDDSELSRQWIRALSMAGQHELAIDTARQETKKNRESPLAWLELGRALNAARRFDQAVEPLNEAIRLQSKDAETRYQLGLAEMQTGNVAVARWQFRTALETDPRHAQAWFQQANIAYFTGDLTKAAHDYQQAIAIKPRWADAHSHLGAVLFAQQNLPAAAAEYRLALELSPNNAGAHYNLGLLLLLQDDLAGARIEIDRAAKLGQPCSAEVAEKLGMDH